MGKSSPRYAKLKEGAETACHISLGTIILCANTAVKGSKKLTEIAALAGENISRGTREFAKTAIQKGKIDKQVLDSIKIQKMNDDIEGWIKSEYERNQDKIIEQSSMNLYKLWLHLLNKYILLNVFGHLIVLDEVKGTIENTKSYSEDERKLNIVALLFIEIQALKKWIDSTNATLPMYLNLEDDNWLFNTIFSIISEPKQNYQSLGRSLAHLNGICTTLLRKLNDIERSASIIDNAIEVQSTGATQLISNIVKDPKNLNPWYLLNNTENVVANVIPGFFTGKAKKRTLKEYKKCVQEYDFLKSIIPPLVVETQRSNLNNIKAIIARDFNYIGKQNQENKEIKRALYKRILKLEAIKRYTKIGKEHFLWMSYEEIIKKIITLSTDCTTIKKQY